MAPFHVPVQFMLDAGRLAYGAALAVPPVLSRLAMLERYYRDRSVGLPARWTPAEAHDNAVANLPATVRAVAASLLVDRLTVIDRDGGVLYDGADPDMFAGQWERGFHRPLSAVETADARMRLRPLPLGLGQRLGVRVAARGARDGLVLGLAGQEGTGLKFRHNDSPRVDSPCAG